MTRRIPHTDHAVITGEKKTGDYLKMQKRLGRFYFRGFMDLLAGFGDKGSFLEVGPGPGYQTCLVAKRMRETTITALEYSSDMITIAREYVRSQSLEDRIELIHGSVEDERTVAGLGKFDLIYSTFSLHHWHDPKRAIANLYKALKDEGSILLYDFVRSGIFYYLPIKKGLWESVRASYTPEEIVSMLSDLRIGNYQVGTGYPYMWTAIYREAAGA